MAAELFHVDGRTGRQADMTKLKVAFQNSANAAKPAGLFNRALTANPSKISGTIQVLFFRKPKKIGEEMNYRQPRFARYRLTTIPRHWDLTRLLKLWLLVRACVCVCEEIKLEKYCDLRDKSWNTKRPRKWGYCCSQQKQVNSSVSRTVSVEDLQLADPQHQKCNQMLYAYTKHITSHCITLWHICTNTVAQCYSTIHVVPCQVIAVRSPLCLNIWTYIADLNGLIS